MTGDIFARGVLEGIVALSSSGNPEFPVTSVTAVIVVTEWEKLRKPYCGSGFRTRID
jgi:hypothetical protein